MGPVVSIVIPTRNRPRRTLRAVHSALAQTATVEVIVVDDGSTDDTVARLRTTFGSRVVVSQEKPRGASAARNVGLAQAKGRYVAFLDSDDTYEPAFAEALAASLDSTGLPIASAAWDVRVDDDRERESFGVFSRDALVPHVRPKPMIGQLNLWRHPRDVTGNVLYRTEFLRGIGGFDPAFRKGQDWELTARAYAQTRGLARIDAVLHHQYTHRGERIREAVSHRIMYEGYATVLDEIARWAADPERRERAGCTEAEMHRALATSWSRLAVIGFQKDLGPIASRAAREAARFGGKDLGIPPEAPWSVRLGAQLIPMSSPEIRLRHAARLWSGELRGRALARRAGLRRNR